MQNLLNYIIFGLFVFIAFYWIFRSVAAFIKGGTERVKSFILPALLLACVDVFFYTHPNIPKYNILWVAPPLILFEMFLYRLITALQKRRKGKA